MCRQQKEPLRPLSAEERDQLERLSRSLTMPADQVIHAKEVLAVADGHPITLAARLAGRKSGDAVAHLIARFNREGLLALETRHRGGPRFRYRAVECERILREFRRPPDRRLDGTATWSLVALQRGTSFEAPCELRLADAGRRAIRHLWFWDLRTQQGKLEEQEEKAAPLPLSPRSVHRCSHEPGLLMCV